MTMHVFPLEEGPLPGVTGVVGGWRITSYFGGRIDPLTGRPGNHGGMDLAYSTCYAKPIFAPCDGTVSQAWDPGGGGWWTTLRCDDGSRWGFGHATRYADPSLNGRRVTTGTLLAYVGTSGASTGAHLHLAWAPPPGQSYSDPYDQLCECAAAGRFPDAPPTPPHHDDGDEDMAATNQEVLDRLDRVAVGIVSLEVGLVDPTALAVRDILTNPDGQAPTVYLDGDETKPVNLSYILTRLEQVADDVAALRTEVDAIPKA